VINDTSATSSATGCSRRRQAVARLRARERYLARLGGDEFVILLEEFGEDSNLTEIARKLLASVADLDSIDGREIGLS